MVEFLVPGLGKRWLGFRFQVYAKDSWVFGSRFRKWMVGFLVPRLGYGLLAFWFQA